MLGENASDRYQGRFCAPIGCKIPNYKSRSTEIEKFQPIISEAENDESAVVAGFPGRRSNILKNWLLAGSVAITVVGLGSRP
jgi:hypothetical protein